MSRYLIDIEADNLLSKVSKTWIIGGIDLDNGQLFYCLDGDLSWKERLSKASLIVGHNIIGYDLPALFKVHGWRPNKRTNIHDTMLMSQAQDYRRFEMKGHSLKTWGEFLNYPKIEFDDFSQYSEKMLEYWKGDISLNTKVYEYLVEELKRINEKNPNFKQALKNEHDVAKFCSYAEEKGWLMDRLAAERLLQEMEEEMQRTAKIINPLLKTKINPIDGYGSNGLALCREPIWTKKGTYNVHTARYLGVDPEEGLEEEPICQGPYTRIEVIEPTIDNMEDVKTWLYSIGWEPDDWNYKVINGQKEKTSPKLSESSLLALGELGELFNKYTTTKSRHGILQGWLEAMDANNRLHGSCFTIATPTGRARHSILVNVPGAESVWGKEIRQLFKASPGYKIVGADSSGNQFRALCHYLRNDDYTKLVLEGDVHQENANLLTEILRELKVYNEKEEVKRKTAKPFIYAFLFGAGGSKLSLIVLGKRDEKIGNKMKNEFIKRVPGLAELTDKINKIYFKTRQTGWPYILGVDGRRIYCDSAHKALNYLLQSFEAISCKAAVAYHTKKLEEENIPYNPLVWYHDEHEIEVPEQFAERAKELAIEAYREAGKIFGMMILDGAGKIGDTWYDVH